LRSHSVLEHGGKIKRDEMNALLHLAAQRPSLALLTCNGNSNPHTIRAGTRRHKRPRHHSDHNNFYCDPKKTSNPLDDRLIVTIDMKQMKRRASEWVENARTASQSAFQRLSELPTSVIASHSDHRLVIAVRRSSLQFMAIALICSVLVLLAYKLFRWPAWGSNAGQLRGFVRRDRSLGGRQVLVSKRGLAASSNYSKGFNYLSSPLAAGGESRSEREMVNKKKNQQQYAQRKEVSSLPSWWPLPDVAPVVSADEYKSAQFQANTLLKVIMDNRMNGRDFAEEEIVQLRRICKTSGAMVLFQTVNVRDSFYRAAVNFVLDTCSSLTSSSSFVGIGGEEATRFVAGLAGNIGIEADRAAIMVNAAIAARTRSTFLQAWALKMQARNVEAHDLFLKLSQIYSLFPLEKNSPEMEMAAESLKSHLKLEERKELLKMYTEACGALNRTVAVEALGLISTLEGMKK